MWVCVLCGAGEERRRSRRRRRRRPYKRAAAIEHKKRASNAAAEWIEAHAGRGAVVKEKFVGGSSWSSAYVYSTSQVCVFLALFFYLCGLVGCIVSIVPPQGTCPPNPIIITNQKI